MDSQSSDEGPIDRETDLGDTPEHSSVTDEERRKQSQDDQRHPQPSPLDGEE